MRLEFEPNVSAFPLVENEIFEEVGYSPSRDFDSLLKKGIAAAQAGQRAQARTMLLQASEMDPRSEDAWMWLASISDYPEELHAFLDHVLKINPDNSRAITWLAATRSLLAKTFVERAVVAHEEGSDELAEQCLEKALAHDNDCELAWFRKASFSNSDAQKAEFFKKVLEINPANEDAQNGIDAINRGQLKALFDDAKSAAVAGSRDRAIELADQYLTSVSDNAEAWILRSHLALGMNEKLGFLENALKVDPANSAARAGYDFLSTTIGSMTEPSTADDNGISDFAMHTTDDSLVVDEVSREVPAPAESVMAAGNDAAIDLHAPSDDDDLTVELLPVAEASTATDDDAAANEAYIVAETSVDERPAPIEIVDPIDDFEDADRPTVENLAPLMQEALAEEHAAASAEVYELEEAIVGPACPFCAFPGDDQAFECTSCGATLSISDIESLLTCQNADHEMIQQSVTQMEAEWNLREFDETELTFLGIGHFNLHNYDSGFKYLQEASRLNPNNVILAGQVNALAIRLDEIRRQDETRDAMPRGKTILVVDDSPTVRKLISGKLEKSGHNVVCAVDGVEALERLAETLPDLVLLDITMPRMDGYEVCKQIRANPAAKDLPVVMISGKDGFFDKVRGRIAGTTGYVTKPFGPETLMKALETYLRPDSDTAD